MSFFSAEDLKAPVARKESTVELPELGKTMRLLAWSADAGLKVESARQRMDKDPGNDAVQFEFMTAIVVPSVVDAEGKSVFNAASFKAFAAKVSTDTLSALSAAIIKLNVPAKPGNSSGSTAADSPSDSV